MRKLALNFALAAVLAVAMLWFVQSHLLSAAATEDQSGWEALWSAARAVPWWGIPAYGLSFLAVHVIRTVRWVLQVRPLGETDWRKVFRVCAVGYAAIVLFPFRLGELVRPYLLARVSDKVDFGEAMGTAVVERVLDGLFITGLLFLAVATAPEPASATVRAAGMVCAAVFSGAAGGLVIFVLARGFAQQLLRLTFGLVDKLIARATGRELDLAGKIEGLLLSFVGGLSSLRASGALWSFLGLTVLYWSVNAAGIWLLATAFGIALPFWGGFGVLAVLVVGIMVPSAPGFLGTFQLALTEGLRLYVPLGAIGAVGLAFALVMNVVQIVIQVTFALPFLSALDMRFADIFRLQREASNEAGG